jgi:RNA polymerase sigma factor (sigma-70 family)
MYIQTGPTAWAKADRTEGVLSLPAEHSSNATQSRRFQARASESVAENLLRAFPSAEEERGLFIAWREKADDSARSKIVKTHLQLVRKIARARWEKENKRSCLVPPLQELVGEGILALYPAITSFDPDAPNRFAAYAKKWVHGAIGKYILKHQSVVRGAAFDELIDPLQNDDGHSFDPVDPGPSPEDLCERQSQLRVVNEAISHLGPRERRIFESRRMADEPITLAELSVELGVSIERVRQIEQRTFDEVKEWITSHDFSARMARASGKAFRELPTSCNWPHPGGESPAICDTFAGSVKSTCFILMSGRFFCIHSRTPLVRSFVLK